MPHANTRHYDAIVLGAGGIGSAALYHLARRGVRALAIDRFAPGHDRGSSHGDSRIIRLAYFEHPDYVPMAQRSLQMWRELQEARGEQLLSTVGFVQIGPPDGEVVPGALESAARHNLAVEKWSPSEAAERLPGFHIPEGMVTLFEREAGYLRVEPAVIAFAELAAAAGAELRLGESIKSWRVESSGAEPKRVPRKVIVETDRDRYTADRLIVTAGAWASQLLQDLNLPLTVLRKPLYWWRTSSDVYRVERGCPTYLFENADGWFYGFPQIDDWGVKVAEHSGGRVVADPSNVDREIDPIDQRRVESFVGATLEEASRICTRHTVCMYTMTPDTHFVVDRHPRYEQVAFTAGLSGHGYKFAPILGKALADLAIDGRTDAPIEFLRCDRPALKQPSV